MQLGSQTSVPTGYADLRMEGTPPLQMFILMLRKTLRSKVAGVILLPILLIICLLTRLTTFHPTFQRGHSQSSESSVTVNDAIIRIIKKGRSPNLRHVSRIHRVDVDWLSERINVDNAMSIRYGRATEQLAESLTNGAFAPVQ